ncbi:hypothetical protein HMPREF0372_00897 [Flavonifractor plautii ATCC 29863]|uniref:Uncharacterized protein n=1 Tax=Flavonifractor plautii ATCC 29863 TaxID=411475 RepID=G9YN26_FLAPL|nr:hypothetical protein HMPREF0372_00897 [Flavonifractor plautii ATCC 29863]
MVGLHPYNKSPYFMPPCSAFFVVAIKQDSSFSGPLHVHRPPNELFGWAGTFLAVR